MSKSKPSTPAVQVIAAPADLEEDNPWLDIPRANVAVMDNITRSAKKGMHPNSLANLAPAWTKGHSPIPGTPTGPHAFYPVSRALKDLLTEGTSREIAHAMLEAAKQPGGRGYPIAVTTILERSEGKVSGDEAKAPTVNILNVIVKDAETKADLTLLRDMGKPPALTEGVTDANGTS